MKTIILLGSLFLTIASCHNSIQPADLLSASAKEANGSVIIGTPRVSKSTIDSTGQKPTGFSITAVKLDIDKIMTSGSDSTGTRKGNGVVYADTLWKETTTKLTATSGLNQSFKLINVPSGTYRVIVTATNSQLRRILDKIKVSENAVTDLGEILL